MSHRGVKELKKYLNGGILTRSQTIVAACAFCMGNYLDGRVDCKIPECPLYPYQPYQKSILRPVSHRKTHTPEERKVMGDRLHRGKVESVV